jgi:hypothetical protein
MQARGVVHSLDQTTPVYQGVLRHLRERSEDVGLIRRVGVRAGGHCQKTTGAGPEPLQNSAHFQRDRIRENSHFGRVFQLQRRVLGHRALYSIESIRLQWDSIKQKLQIF